VAADIRLVGDGMKDIVRHVLRIGSGEAHAHLRHLACHHAQQFSEAHSALHALSGWRKPVAVHVLPQQRHFLETSVAQVSHLAQYALHVAAALPAPRVGHDAVMAEVVASAHDAHESAHLVRADSLRHHVAIRLRLRQFYVYGIVSVLTLGNHVRQVKIAVGTAHQVGVMVLNEVVLHPLRHTSQYAEDKPSALLLLGVERLQPVVNLVFRVLSDAAGVEQYGVRHVFVFTQLVACHLHYRGYHLAVCHVHLASVCLYKEFLHCL